ncbi:hypothetical protein G4V62_17015 [Bacillaceae bacterium SIJ1]|uniref:hypothetical protein n=1 Tax=Litoribacterium kuwaitense TaxID=1398745 RepID=UPI0013ECF6A7|nr:hypothetical protein [Litoribacterium kuwaitense]NGP46563.1 hypothetical protein [Litoribacterium kuwaitense]
MGITTDKFLRLQEQLLEEYIELDQQYYFHGNVVGFLSLGNPEQRCTVIPLLARDPKKLFAKMYSEIKRKVKERRQEFEWVKVDIAKDFEVKKFRDLNMDILKTKKNYFRKGFSLDRQFHYALLEQEINGNAILSNVGKSDTNAFNMDNLTNYFTKHKAIKKGKEVHMDDDVVIFNTDGKFIEEDTVISIHDEYYEHGRRKYEELTQEDIKNVIVHSSNYLAQQVQADGKFVYGYFSCFDKKINFYNSLRHASTVYSMIEGYELNRDPVLKDAIDRAIAYLIHKLIRIDENQNKAYVIDWENHQEIKLGANAAAILALTKYASTFNTTEHLLICEQLANSIVSFQQPNGSFNHVYTYPSFELKETFRIIYYDGEAAFALMRLYQLDQNSKWLLAVESAFEYFIDNDYWKNHDHWLSYCTNELTKFKPEEKYFAFGLKNVIRKMDFIYHRKTTYPTFLELTLAAYEMVERMQELKLDHLLEKTSVPELIKVIKKRAAYQLNGYYFPEVAMYFKKPERILHSFFIRHHSFRVRIDDVEHNISGYRRYFDLIHKLEGALYEEAK